MSPSCGSCGDDLPTHTRDAVEDGELDEVVQHITDADESFVVSETTHYCDLQCAADALGGDA